MAELLERQTAELAAEKHANADLGEDQELHREPDGRKAEGVRGAAHHHRSDNGCAGKAKALSNAPAGGRHRDQRCNVRETRLRKPDGARERARGGEAVVHLQPERYGEDDEHDARRLHENDRALIGAGLLGHGGHVREAARHGGEKGGRPVEAGEAPVERHARRRDEDHERHEDHEADRHRAHLAEDRGREGRADGDTERCPKRSGERAWALDRDMQNRGDQAGRKGAQIPGKRQVEVDEDDGADGADEKCEGKTRHARPHRALGGTRCVFAILLALRAARPVGHAALPPVY